jgi:hypothetical protein
VVFKPHISRRFDPTGDKQQASTADIAQNVRAENLLEIETGADAVASTLSISGHKIDMDFSPIWKPGASNQNGNME